MSAASRAYGDEIPPAPEGHEEVRFTVNELPAVRAMTRAWAEVAGIGPVRSGDLVLAINELATNSIRYANGRGLVRSWREPGALVCEVRDCGRMSAALAGRGFSEPTPEGGRGLWLVNQLCDLVQLRSLSEGTTVRVHMAPDPQHAAAPVAQHA